MADLGSFRLNYVDVQDEQTLWSLAAGLDTIIFFQDAHNLKLKSAHLFEGSSLVHK